MKPGDVCRFAAGWIGYYSLVRLENRDVTDQTTSGVYCDDGSGAERLVHEYTDEDYDLEDIHRCFGLGRLESDDGGLALSLVGDEIRRLKVMADAQSFDHPEDFIIMCLDIFRFASSLGPGPHRFIERVG